MDLGASSSSIVSITVTGYQFPHAEDPMTRYSWHLVAGAVDDGIEVWKFEQPALACHETPAVSAWLFDAAEWCDRPDSHQPIAPLSFIEPNLAFSVTLNDVSGIAVVEVAFDLECRPPQQLPIDLRAGRPYRVSVPMSSSALRTAAAQWNSGWAPYPPAG